MGTACAIGLALIMTLSQARSQSFRLPDSMALEASGFGGSTVASSFGSDFNTAILGGRSAVSIRPMDRFSAQVEVQGEHSGVYCPACFDSSYLAGGGHLDLTFAGGTDAGLFGGYAGLTPTFHAPHTTDGFVGGEIKHDFGAFLLGGQGGYLNNVSGPGTLTNAWFVEGRAQVAIEPWLGSSMSRTMTMGVRLGYAEGKISNGPISASSTQWGSYLGVRLPNTPAKVFVDYTGFTNRQAALGTVWTENRLTGGLVYLIGAPPEKLEPMTPLPLVLNASYKF